MSHNGQRLHLEIGQKVKVEITGKKTPFNAVFVGLELDHFIVLRLPLGSGIHEYLYEGSGVVIKYVGFGKVFGFKTTVIGYLLKKSILAVFLTYPEAVETVELRTEKRVDCYLPAHLKSDQHSATGFVLDLSTGGCRFGCSPFDECVMSTENIGKNVTLVVVLLGMEGTQNIPCLVKGVQHQGLSISIGLQFVDLEDKIAGGISRMSTKYLAIWKLGTRPAPLRGPA